jgi:hypothetical protein
MADLLPLFIAKTSPLSLYGLAFAIFYGLKYRAFLFRESPPHMFILFVASSEISIFFSWYFTKQDSGRTNFIYAGRQNAAKIPKPQ